jgi:hypothetical protein
MIDHDLGLGGVAELHRHPPSTLPDALLIELTQENPATHSRFLVQGSPHLPPMHLSALKQRTSADVDALE